MQRVKINDVAIVKPPVNPVLPDKQERAKLAMLQPQVIARELNNRSLYEFIQCFWGVISNQDFKPNWHIEYLCSQLEIIAHHVGSRRRKLHDLIINVPPGTTKTITCSIMFPAWCWTKWYWMRFITASYSSALSLESAEYCRDLIRSDLFKRIYPELDIREDKDTKSNFRIVRRRYGPSGKVLATDSGGNRYSTSVGGTLIGFHGDIIIWDDPINPQQSASEKELISANRWIDETLPTRKTDKNISTVIGIMQRLHQDDPSGHILAKQKENIKHICLPGEIRQYKHMVNPPELVQYYVDGLLDAKRMNWEALKDLEADLGQYGYAGQIGQDPTPPGGGLFKIDHFQIQDSLTTLLPDKVVQTVRYWDKAATAGKSCFTVGVKMSKLRSGRFLIEDVKRGQWGVDQREAIIYQTARSDGEHVRVYLEQEPGSGGKESVQSSILGLAGFSVFADRPTGDKVFRADPYAVQVNNGNVYLLRGTWNAAYLEELRYFPYSTNKDQVDASSGAFSKLTVKKMARSIL